jgi:hypothetical protein
VRTLKSALRAALRTTQSWLAEPPPPPDPSRHRRGEHSYDWLNAAFTSLKSDRACAARPAYLWGVLQAAGEASTLGVPRITALEFGVAGGRGLLALERIAARVGELAGVAIDVVGFDTGTGLPEPIDHRDVPNLLATGRFPMDVEALRRQLTNASLVLGGIDETLPTYLQSGPPPAGFVSIDVDLYSSTVHTLRLFDADAGRLLPRVYCYFDDILGFTYSDCNGELLAMAEFNAAHSRRKIGKIHGLGYRIRDSMRSLPWVECMYIAHIFDHVSYATLSSVASPDQDQTYRLPQRPDGR